MCATLHLCKFAHMHNSTFSPNSLIATSEASEILQVSVATVNRWAANGTLVVAVKSPGPRGANLFHRSEILSFKKQQTKRRPAKAGA